jgi:hypothetical protein
MSDVEILERFNQYFMFACRAGTGHFGPVYQLGMMACLAALHRKATPAPAIWGWPAVDGPEPQR